MAARPVRPDFSGQRILSGLPVLFRVFRNRSFALYTAGSAISLVGTWMQRIGVGWLTWELTQSGAWLGFIAFADLAPAVLVGPIAGVAADRWNKLTITRISQFLGIVQALALAAVLATGHMTIWILFAISFFHGVVVAFNQPARLALIHALVGQESIGPAVAINAITFNLARFVGPALAGVLIVGAGLIWTFAANAISFAIFLIVLLVIRLREEPIERRSGNFIAQTIEGFRYTARHPGISAVMILMIASCVGARPVIELLPGFAADVFGAGAEALAIMSAAVAVGAMANGLWLGSREGIHGLTRVTILSALGMALSFIAFSFVNSLWLAVPTLVAAGFFMVGTGIASQTLIQVAVDPGMRGRVLSLHGLIFRGGPAIGALLMGLASEFIGLQWPVTLFCGGLIVVGLWIGRQQKAVAQALENLPGPGEKPH